MNVIINADDFGYSKVFNTKILDLLERDALKSVTVLVNRLNSEQSGQVSELRELHGKKGIGVGIEIEFNNPEAGSGEIHRQYEKFISIFGFKPSHFNIHTPKALMELPNSSAILQRLAHEVLKFAKECDLPMNNDADYKIVDFSGVKTTTQPLLIGTFITFDEIKRYVKSMKDGETYEILFHPGEYDPKCPSSLNAERKNDYEKVLKLKEFIDRQGGIRLISYTDMRNRERKSRLW